MHGNLPNSANETSFSPARARFFLLLSLGVILYLTLYPFDFGPKVNPFDLSLPFGPKHHSLPDMLSNFCFFIPFGVFFFWSFPVKGRLFWGCLAGALVSLGVEILQQYLPGRSPSLTDLLFNTAGTFTGLVAAPQIRKVLRLRAQTLDLLALALAFYLLYEPFLFTFDWGEIKENLKHFSPGLDLRNVFLPSVLLGFALRRYPFIFVLFLFGILEFGRLFLVSTPPILGSTLARFFFTLLCYAVFQKRSYLLRPLFAGAYLLEALYPYHFSWPSHLPWENLIPFQAGFSSNPLDTTFNLLRSVFLFFFWGACGGSLKGALLLAGASEILQLFVPGRYFDLTTLILAALGVLAAQKLTWRGKDAL